jgi:hypothetical protein
MGFAVNAVKEKETNRMNYRINKTKGWALVRLFLIVAALGIAIAFPGAQGMTWAAIVATPVIAKTNYKSWTLTALDADTTASFNHGFKQTAPSGNPATDVAPDEVVLTPTTSAIALAGAYAVSVSATQITVTKQNAANSGGATPGTTVVAKVNAWRPHSIAE